MTAAIQRRVPRERKQTKKRKETETETETETDKAPGTEQETAGNQESGIYVAQAEQEKIISDYKLALGILFEAWKSPDIATFRSKINTAYTGDILEKHCARAEQYIAKGTGLYVTKVSFDHVKIESADNNSATLTASYRYTVKDYHLTEKQPVGAEQNHFIELRVNLVKINAQWLITGETVI